MPSNISLMPLPRALRRQNITTEQARLGHSAISLQLYVHPVEQRDQEASEHFGKLIERDRAVVFSQPPRTRSLRAAVVPA